MKLDRLEIPALGGRRLIALRPVFRQVAWASVPVWSFGYLAFAPFLYLAMIRRRVREWTESAAYLAAMIMATVLAVSGYSAQAGTLIVLIIGFAAVHLLIAFRPGAAFTSWRDKYVTGLADPGQVPDIALMAVDGPRAGTCLALNQPALVLGRSADGWRFFAGDPAVSRRHLLVRPGRDGSCMVEDLGSAEGTFLNGARIGGPAKLHLGDEVRLGRIRMRVTLVTPQAAPATASRAGTAVSRASRAPQQPGSHAGAPAILRADHVQLFERFLRMPFVYMDAGSGWLTLTRAGEVRIYEKKPADLAVAPALSAPSTKEFVRKVGIIFVHGTFGENKRSVWFTGGPHGGPAEDMQQTTGSLGDALTNIGTLTGGLEVRMAGSMASLAAAIWALRNVLRNHKGRAAARRAWYPVLLDAREWILINAVEGTSRTD